MTEWTGPEVARVAGIEYRTFNNWRRQGLIEPSIEANEGSGYPDRYSDDDVVHACVLAAARPFLTVHGLDQLVRPASPSEHPDEEKP